MCEMLTKESRSIKSNWASSWTAQILFVCVLIKSQTFWSSFSVFTRDHSSCSSFLSNLKILPLLQPNINKSFASSSPLFSISSRLINRLAYTLEESVARDCFLVKPVFESALIMSHSNWFVVCKNRSWFSGDICLSKIGSLREYEDHVWARSKLWAAYPEESIIALSVVSTRYLETVFMVSIVFSILFIVCYEASSTSLNRLFNPCRFSCKSVLILANYSWKECRVASSGSISSVLFS